MNRSDKSTPSEGAAGSLRGWTMAAILAATGGWVLVNFTPIKFRLPSDLLSVDMYSPPDLQARHAELAPKVKWQTGMAEMIFAGLSLGLIPAVLIRSDRKRGQLLLVGSLVGLAAGSLAGQVGWMLRAAIGDGALSSISADSIVHESILYFVVSSILGIALASVYYYAASNQAGQRAMAVLLACGIGGAFVPLVASPFPKMMTQFFPPEGLGLSGVWFGLIGLFSSLFPSVIGSRRVEPNSGNGLEDQTPDDSTVEGDVEPRT